MLLGLSVRIFQSSGLRSTPFVSADLTIPDHKGIEVGRKVFLEMLKKIHCMIYGTVKNIRILEEVTLSTKLVNCALTVAIKH